MSIEGNSRVDLRNVSNEEIRHDELIKREEFLRQIGFFDNDIEGIKKERPTLYDVQNIKQKIEDLKELGFSDPNKMITSLPAILGLNIENIKRKLSTIVMIFNLYSIEIDPIDFIQSNLSLLGTKLDKIWIIARSLQTLKIDKKEITPTFLSRLLFSNVTDVTVAVMNLARESNMNVNQTQVKKAILNAKKIPPQEKIEIIKKNENNPKLKTRYKRGYGY